MTDPRGARMSASFALAGGFRDFAGARFSRHGRAVQSSGCNLPLPLVCIAMIRSVRLENQVLR